MIKSVLLKSKKTFIILSAIFAAAVSYCFVASVANPDWLSWGNKCLAQSFDPLVGLKLKKWELVLTDDSFIRLRKIYQNGKQEYFSFHLQQLDDVDYLGNTTTGTLQLKAKADDIIVQTYNDKKGNIDSMATTLTIPVKNMEPERLDSLKEALNYFKTKGL